MACETAVTTGFILILGEVTTSSHVDIPSIARKVVLEAGYSHPEYGFNGETCGVMVSLKEQSSDIALGVDRSQEAKAGSGTDELDITGAGDQGVMVGYACMETPELMPMPILLAHKLCQRLAEVRKNGTLPYLRPDGKSQVSVEYQNGVPLRVDSVVISTQHSADMSRSQIAHEVVEHVVKEVIPAALLDANTKFYVNATGLFVIGGPVSDTGFTGRKNVVDNYGPAVPHGGGAFSGKDPTKVDRSAAYMARYIAKNVVAAGLADQVQVEVSYVIGVARPLSIAIETFDTAKTDESTILELVHKHFDLRPAAIIQSLDLRRPIYRQTAAYGHFGRHDIELPWEQTDKAELLKQEAMVK